MYIVMDKALAQLLTTALVQFVDKNQPKDKMCVSSIEAEELERVFSEEKFNRIEDWYVHRMQPELTEFEKCMLDFAKARDEYEFDSTKVVELNDKVVELTKSYAKTLLMLAKKELLSYADESNPAIEAVADLERTFSCNPDNLPKWLKEELAKKHLDGYCMGREDTLREIKDFVESHFNPKKAKEGENLTGVYYKDYVGNPDPVPTGVAYKSPQCCTDVMITPNTNSGTSTLKADWKPSEGCYGVKGDPDPAGVQTEKDVEKFPEDKSFEAEWKEYYNNSLVARLPMNKREVARHFYWFAKKNAWEPSEEQMEALNALNCHGEFSYIGQQNELISLYNDLKRL